MSWHLCPIGGLGTPVADESAKALCLPFGSGCVLGGYPIAFCCSLTNSSITSIGQFVPSSASKQKNNRVQNRAPHALSLW